MPGTGNNGPPDFLPSRLGPKAVGPIFFARLPVVSQPPPPPPPVVVAPYVVSRQARARALISRGAPAYAVRWGAPPPPLRNPGTIVRPLSRPQKLRQTPPSTIVPVAQFVAPTFIAPRVAVFTAPRRPRKTRNVPSSTILPTGASQQQFVAPAPLVVSQAVERAQIARGAPAYAVRWGAPPPPVPPGVFLLEAVRRAQRPRPAPRPHLAPPVVSTPTFVPGPTLVYQSADYARRSAPRPHLARPVASTPFVAPRGTFLYQATERSALRRSGSINLPRLGSSGPVPAGEFNLQALQRPLTRRSVPKPHLATPVLTRPFLAPLAVVVSQSTERAVRRRSGAVRLPSLGARSPVPAGEFNYQALRRAYVGRGPHPKPHVAAPVVATAVRFRSAGLLLYQALPRAQERRYRDVAPAPHLPPRTLAPPGPGALVRSQAVLGRALLARSGRVRLPVRGASAPVPRGTFVSQSLQRPLVGRRVIGPHLAKPVVSTFVPGVARVPLVWYQAVQRAQERRYRDVAPAPHLPPRTLAPVGPGATIKLQSQARALVERRGRVHLPALGAPRPVGPGTFVSQAKRRPYLGRTVPKPHLAPPAVTITVSFLAPRALIASQAIKRGTQARLRTVPRPHLAAPVVARPPLRPGTIVLASRARSLVRREGRVKLPKFGSPPPAARPAKILGQALRRPYVRRETPRPHLAPPVLPLPLFVTPVKTTPTIVSQAIWGALFRRRKFVVPPRIPPNLSHPAPPPPPRPPITSHGTTSPREQIGTTAPLTPRTGTTSPSGRTGATSPNPGTGTTSPRPQHP